MKHSTFLHRPYFSGATRGWSISCERAGMRVVNFTDTYLPRRDGIITSIRTLATALSEAGHPSLTVVPRHPDQPDDESLLRLRSVPCGIADLQAVHLVGPPGRRRRHPRPGGRASGRCRPRPHARPGRACSACWRRSGSACRWSRATCTDLRRLRRGVPGCRPGLSGPRCGSTPAGSGCPGRRCGRTPSARRRPVGGQRREPSTRARSTGSTRLLLGDAHAIVVPTRAVLDRICLPVPDEQVVTIPWYLPALRPSGQRRRQPDSATASDSTPTTRWCCSSGGSTGRRASIFWSRPSRRCLAERPRARSGPRRRGLQAEVVRRTGPPGRDPRRRPYRPDRSAAAEVVAAAYATASVFGFASAPTPRRLCCGSRVWLVCRGRGSWLLLHRAPPRRHRR